MVNNEHEFVVSLVVAEEWGATGTAGLDNQYTTITPKALIGKGFGDVQAELLRPIAITGEIQYICADGAERLRTMASLSQQTPTTVVYGATIQYSLQYMNSYVHEVMAGDSSGTSFLTLRRIFSTPVSNIGPSVISIRPRNA